MHGTRINTIKPTPQQWNWATSPLAQKLCKTAVKQAINKGARYSQTHTPDDLLQEATIYAAARKPLIEHHLQHGREDLAISCIRSYIYRRAGMVKTTKIEEKLCPM